MLVFIFFLIFSFNTVFSADLPHWVSNPECGKNICAVGEGKDLDSASSDARNNILKSFEIKLNSSFRNEVTETKDTSYEVISEESSGILKGVRIDKVFEKNDKFYVLAILDNVKASEDLKFEIKMLDKKMKALIDDNKSPYSMKKLQEMYKKREELNKKYLFLTGKEINEEVTFNMINNKKDPNVTYGLKISDNELKSIVSNLLIENGVKISQENFNKFVFGKITINKEFLDVDSFEKYSFVLDLELKSNNKTIKSINKKFVNTGLNYDQIKSKTMTQISNYLEENIINIME